MKTKKSTERTKNTRLLVEIAFKYKTFFFQVKSLLLSRSELIQRSLIQQGHRHNGDRRPYMWVPISSPLTHMVYLLPFYSYLAGSRSVSASPPVHDTMTNTALEANATSSGKNT